MAPNAAPPLSPDRIFDLLSGFQRTYTLKTAIELDVFSHVAAGATSVAALAKACKASERGVRSLADALVVNGLMIKEGDRYGLTPETAFFLVRNSPA